MTDGPNESELAAYVDGQLDVEGRFAVEDHLRRHPDLAARVMGDLGARSALQLLAQDRRAMPAAVAALGGQGGGGRPDMAQGGGPNGGAADDAVAAVKAALA